MDFAHEEDEFVVFVRPDLDRGEPEAAELPIAHCPSYEEADRLRRDRAGRGDDCVIRYLGTTGGGD